MEKSVPAASVTIRKTADVSAYLPQIDRTDADAEFYKNVSQNSDDLYTICHGESTVGLACICDDTDAYLYIYIFPEYRHRGYGYSAVCAAERHLTASPLQSIAAAYNSRNEIAKKLAEKCGFTEKFCTSVMIYPGEKFELPELPVRQYQDEDFFEAYTLSAEAFHIMRLETGHNPDSVPYPATEEARNDCAATAEERYVYLADNEIIGCAHLDGAEIDNVAVRISRQGEGFGKNFVKYLVNLILEKEIGTPYLYCLFSNRKAWQLYASLGFIESVRNAYAVKKSEEAGNRNPIETVLQNWELDAPEIG